MFRRLHLLAPGLLLAACAAGPPQYAQSLSDWTRQEAAAAAPEPDVRLAADSGLEDYLAYAQLHNPGLRAAFQDWKAALERVPQATSLPDPTLSFSAYVLGNIETRNGPVLGRVGLTQALPWFGTLEAAGSREFEASEAAREAFEAARLEVNEQVREAWHEYAYLGQAVAITAGNLDLLRYWEEVSRIRYESGSGTHADVIRAQVELGKLDDRLRTLRDLRRPIVARLNAALNRPPAAEIGWPQPARGIPVALDEEALQAGLGRTSPVLRGLERRVHSAGHGVTVAEKAFYPDFVVGVDYTFVGSTSLAGAPNSGEDALGIGFGLQLPIWVGRNRAGLREAEAREHAAAAGLAQARNALAAELELALYEFRDADRRLGLYRDTLVSKAEEALQVTASGYETGTSTFLDFIDTQRVLLEFQLAAARADADRLQALAQVERLAGVSLFPDS